MYVLDEPSIGLHQRDNLRLVVDARAAARSGQHGDRGRARRRDDRARGSRRRLRARRRQARRARRGRGPAERIRKHPASITGRFLSGRERIELPTERRVARGALEIRGASENNLRDLTCASRSAC
jgi:excinuclease ABC subunit A